MSESTSPRVGSTGFTYRSEILTPNASAQEMSSARNGSFESIMRMTSVNPRKSLVIQPAPPNIF